MLPPTRSRVSCAYGGTAVLKRFLSIPSDLIFDSRVDRGIPSLAAAPDRKPRFRDIADSIIYQQRLIATMRAFYSTFFGVMLLASRWGNVVGRWPLFKAPSLGLRSR